jgi:tetratricopeptide (TPR) repeat protein
LASEAGRAFIRYGFDVLRLSRIEAGMLRDLRRFDEALYGDALVDARSKSLLFSLRSVITAYGWKTSEDTLPNGTRRLVLRITGGLPGFQALMVRVPDVPRTIILLSNARTMVCRFEDCAIAIGRILDGDPYTLPKRSAAEAIATAVRAGSVSVALERQFATMRADSAQFAVSEPELNRLGYHFLSRGATTSAIDVFRLNVLAFPRSGNVYASLGEAYLASGDTSSAVANYRKSLERDPGNANAVDILERIAP